MLFLHSYLWFVAASFAFVLAILTPHWVTVQTKIDNVRVQRGVFYSCDFIGKTNFAEATNCTSLLEQRRSIDSNKWTYGKYMLLHIYSEESFIRLSKTFISICMSVHELVNGVLFRFFSHDYVDQIMNDN